MAHPKLSPGQKQQFFAKDRPVVREIFWKGQKPNPEWPSFRHKCDPGIHWFRWDRECENSGLNEYIGLPRKCAHHEATKEEEDKLKAFLIFLLVEKSNKTFADFM